jgi:hypothetical protein
VCDVHEVYVVVVVDDVGDGAEEIKQLQAGATYIFDQKYSRSDM